MRQMRFLAFGVVSFVVAIVGTILAPGTFVNRAFSAALCTLLSFNWTVCTVDLGGSSQRVVAANPPAVVADISDYLQAQRDPSEFGDEQPSAPSPQQSSPQAPPFPQDPGPNFPVRREFDEPAFQRPKLAPGQIKLDTSETGNLLSVAKQNGCLQTYEFKKGSKPLIVRTATTSVPVNGVCNDDTPFLIAKFSEDGTAVTLIPSPSPSKVVVIKGINTPVWTISDGTKTEVINLQLSTEKNTYLKTKQYWEQKLNIFSQSRLKLTSQDTQDDYSRSECREGRKYCDTMKMLGRYLDSELTSIAQSTILVGIGLAFGGPIGAGGGALIAFAIELLKNAISFSCTATYGDTYANDFLGKLKEDVKEFKDYLDKRREETNCPARCGEANESGGSQILERVLEFESNSKGGNLRITYETYEVPDRIEIFPIFGDGTRGQSIFNPGFVGTEGEKTATVFITINVVEVLVRATGNQQSSTKWYFKVDCPNIR